MILRTWHCQNARCSRQFDAWESNPECPACHGVRVSWVPAGGHIKGAATKTGDAELRALADIFRMGDMNSAQEGRGAKKVSLPSAPSSNAGNVKTFSGGFAAAIDTTQPAYNGAQCVPTANKIDYRVKATPGSRITPDSGFSKMNVRSNTAIEASHRS
jgi:hypothetical protein